MGDRDASRPKVPAISWVRFQEVQASLVERQQWLEADRFAGLGIVTGHISQIVVLDFDSEAVFNDFATQYPDLLETHIVQSSQRKLPHLYFHLPKHLDLASQKGQGIDLLSDGCYVVAPPTSINGNAYKIIRGGMPMTLTKYDVRCIKAFLEAQSAKASVSVSEQADQAAVSETDDIEPQREVTARDLQSVYRRLLVTHGRNDALFRTSLFARDCHQTIEQTKNALVTLHSQQKGCSGHAKETVQQRQREAVKTIESAFSRPPRPLKPPATSQQGHLSNSVREALMQNKMTYVVRTLEGLLQLGMHPCKWFTANEAVTLLKGLVGRDSVLKALKAGKGEKPFFRPSEKSENTGNAENTVSGEKFQGEIKKCFLIVGKNQEKPQGGRPAQLYRMPTNKEMCKILGVKLTRSDVLEGDDLASARKTRMAMQREFMKRRSGSFTKHWLAARLGICPRTIYTYNQLLPIHSQAMFIETAIHWKTVDLLPFDEPPQGAFLQTAQGKRYPALRTIACRLLAKRERLCLKQQTANFYWYDDTAPASISSDDIGRSSTASHA